MFYLSVNGVATETFLVIGTGHAAPTVQKLLKAKAENTRGKCQRTRLFSGLLTQSAVALCRPGPEYTYSFFCIFINSKAKQTLELWL